MSATQLTFESLVSASPNLNSMSDAELLEHLRSLRAAGTEGETHLARREGIRRGIVIKLECDLDHSDQERLNSARILVGETRQLVEQWEAESESLHRTPKGIREAKDTLSQAVELAKLAEVNLRQVEMEFGLQRTIRYRYPEPKFVNGGWVPQSEN